MSFVLYKYKGHLFWRISKIFAFIKTCIAFPFLIVLVTFFIRSRQKRNFATTAIIYTRYILVILANSHVFFFVKYRQNFLQSVRLHKNFYYTNFLFWYVLWNCYFIKKNVLIFSKALNHGTSILFFRDSSS